MIDTMVQLYVLFTMNELVGSVHIDHVQKRITLYLNDNYLLTLALTQCPVGDTYDVYFVGERMGRGIYRGISSEGDGVKINTSFMPDAPVEHIYMEFKLDV
jgi:hypothetical protein